MSVNKFLVVLQFLIYTSFAKFIPLHYLFTYLFPALGYEVFIFSDVWHNPWHLID